MQFVNELHRREMFIVHYSCKRVAAYLAHLWQFRLFAVSSKLVEVM